MEKDENELFVGRVACRYIRALVIRLTFLIHSLLTLWRVYLLRGDDMYWSLAAVLLLLPLETIITLKVKKGGEWAWFCPSFFFYLLSVLPSIWLLELDRLHRHRDGTNKTISIINQSELIINSTSMVTFNNVSSHTGPSYNISSNIVDIKHNNETILPFRSNSSKKNGSNFGNGLEIAGEADTAIGTTIKQSSVDNILYTSAITSAPPSNVDYYKEQLQNLLNSGLDPDTWVIALEQSMLYLLILGRWFLPRGKLTHDQLSQLLFVYIGMSSDIMELFYLFDEKAVVKDGVVGYVILAAWSISLMQFTLILTAVSAKKRKVTHSMDEFLDKVQTGCKCTHNEIWAILVTVILQDAPFLSIRLYVAIGLNVVTYSLLFFTVKNVLVILLQLYRLGVVGCHEEHVSKPPPNVEMSSSNGRNKHRIMDEENDMYGTFYDDAAVAASHKLKVGVAPLADTEKLCL